MAPTLVSSATRINSARAGDGNAPNGTFESVDPYNNSQRARANAYFVWNPTANFSMGVWATYQFDDQGFTARKVNTDGSVSTTGSDAHLFTFGVRPVWWLWGPLALQGQAGYSYLSNVRDPGARPPSATQAHSASLRSPRPSNREAAFSLVRSCASTRLSPSGLIRSRERLALPTTPITTMDGTLESKRRHGGKRSYRFRSGRTCD